MIGVKTVSRANVEEDMVRWHQRHPNLATTFHDAWYDVPFTWRSMQWCGVPVFKNPMDLFMMHELIRTVRPDIIIETGTAHGGSALFMAHTLDTIGKGVVYTIEKEPYERQPQVTEHHRIVCLQGDSVNPDMVGNFHTLRGFSHERVMVVLDSAHEANHVYAEMAAYGPLVTPGSYLIVEDTNTDRVLNYDGPMWAVHRYLDEHPGAFVQELYCERYLLTFNPGGWLRRP